MLRIPLPHGRRPVCGVLYFLDTKAIDGLCSGYRNWERYGIMLWRENTRDWSLGLGLAASCYALWLRPRQKVGLFQPRKWEISCPAMEFHSCSGNTLSLCFLQETSHSTFSSVLATPSLNLFLASAFKHWGPEFNISSKFFK